MNGFKKWEVCMICALDLSRASISEWLVFCDSADTMSRAYNKIYNGKSRHISLRHAYVRQLIEEGVITITFVKSCENLVDPFTKALLREVVMKTLDAMGMKLN